MTAQLSWHEQNLVAITVLEIEWKENEICIKFELWMKNVSEMDCKLSMW